MAEEAATRASALGTVISRSAGRAATGCVGWPVAVGALCFTLTVVRLPTTADSYLDLVGGRLISRHGIPHTDTLSLLGHGRSWVDQQWLAQLALYGVWRVAGHVGLGFALALLLALAYGLLARLCMVLGAAPQRAMLWALLAFLGSAGYTAVRAEMFSYPAFVLTLGMLARDARRREFSSSFAWVFVVLALWANLHGAVVLGALLVFLYCLGRAGLASLARRRRTATLYAASALVAVACLFATPYGVGEERYYRGVFASSLLREYENEWARPRLTYLLDWMTFAFVVVAVAVLGLALRKRYGPNPALVLAALVTGALAFDAVRYQPWFAIAGAALAAATLAGIRPAPAALDVRFLRLGAAGLGVVTIVAAASASPAHLDRGEVALARGVLAAAARWQGEHPRARILADQNTSDRLLWWYPSTEGHVALDLRLDFYDPDRVREWFAYIFGRRLTPVGGVAYDVYVASSANASLDAKIRRSRCFEILYADRYGVAAARGSTSRACRG